MIKKYWSMWPARCNVLIFIFIYFLYISVLVTIMYGIDNTLNLAATCPSTFYYFLSFFKIYFNYNHCNCQ
jgi:hypothetical protein